MLQRFSEAAIANTRDRPNVPLDCAERPKSPSMSLDGFGPLGAVRRRRIGVDDWPDPLVKAVEKLSPKCREHWKWFNLGAAPDKTLNKIVSDRPVGVEWHTPSETRRLIGLMSDMHRQKLAEAKKTGKRMVGTLFGSWISPGAAAALDRPGMPQ